MELLRRRNNFIVLLLQNWLMTDFYWDKPFLQKTSCKSVFFVNSAWSGGMDEFE